MAENRYASLDGWRGISIILVLLTHLMPLGPKQWQINSATGIMGMALFFTLSGFLMTNFLIYRPFIVEFIIRRFFRILPLAWLYFIIALSWKGYDLNTWLAHFLFYGNWPPFYLTNSTAHIWSLCVEIQFYILIALIVAIFSRKGLMLIPILCIAVTFNRYYHHTYVSIETYYRLDEILSGCILALIYNRKFGTKAYNFIKSLNPYFVFVLFAISSHEASESMNYFRPYFAASLVGITLLNSGSRLSRLIDNRVFVYIASISYALYVIHPILGETWLGEGEKMVKYAKRPILFLVLFILAHLSTYYYEHKCIDLGKKLVTRFQPKKAVSKF